jgi:hypothetical protein
MANPPPPYANISGITRTIMKDNQEESIANYDGNARPGELVVDLNNYNIYIGDTDGNLNLINTGGGSGNSEPAGSVGAIQLNAGGNLFGASANLSFANNTLTTANVIPAADNTYFLGDETHRWANIWLGPGTIYMTDTANTANIAELTVSDGVLFVNGAAGLQANLINGTTSLNLNNNGNIAISVGGTSNSMVISSNSATISGNAVVTRSSASFNPNFTDASGTTAGATVTGRYIVMDGLCYFRVYIDFSTCTNFGTGQYQISLPFPAVATMTQRSGTLHQVTGNSLYHIAGITEIATSNTVHNLYYSGSTTDLAWKYNTPVGATTVTSHFDLSGWYEIA